MKRQPDDYYWGLFYLALVILFAFGMIYGTIAGSPSPP